MEPVGLPLAQASAPAWQQGLDLLDRAVAAGGHDIPESRIRERGVMAPPRLVEPMPTLHELRVFDNSAEAESGRAVQDLRLVLHLQSGGLRFPLALADLRRTPAWAKPIVQAARDPGQRR